jgi:hypothetical protein
MTFKEYYLKEHEEAEFHFPLMVYHGTDLESAKDIKQNGLDLSKCYRGYFGKAFYVTDDEKLANDNYAKFSDDEGDGVVLKFKLTPINKVLDLRNSKDSDTYSRITNSKYTGLEKHLRGKEIYRLIGFDEFPDIMKSVGIDAVYDRSFEGFAVYNLKILNIV